MILRLLLIAASLALPLAATATDGTAAAAGTSAAGSPAPAASVDPVAFLRPGELFELRLGWGLFSNSGTTRIETVREEIDGQPRLKVKVSTKSRGVVDSIYPIANNSESVIDPSTGRPLSIRIEGRAGKRPTKTLTVFNYAENTVVHTDDHRPGRSGTAVLPAEPAYDLMVAMLLTRTWGLKPGESRRVLCANEDDFYTIEITALADEKVRTPAGTFAATVLEPKQIGEAKGFFRRGGAMKVWVSKGDSPQIVRIDTRTKAGTVTALLQKAAAPAASPAGS